MKRKFVDIFAGMGTIRIGFEQAGWECVYSIEYDIHKRNIYKTIFDKEPEGGDIREVRSECIPKADCWTFGSPCQDLSIAGKRKGLIEGERSSMFFEVMRLLSEIKEEDRPTWLLFENVKGIFSSNGGYDFLEVLYQMGEVGYDCEWQLLNSKNFGVPQNRERVFVVGHFRGRSTRQIFPINSIMDCKNPAVTITARGYGSQRNGTYVVKDRPEINQVGMLDIKGFAEACEGDSINLSMPNSKTRRGRVGNGVANTLDTSCNQGTLIGDKIRKLTPKECMRLQGVPDYITDKLIDSNISDSQLYRAAGDATTVNVLYEIASRL